ncbi:MAG: RagB/SusD family nutrient uptake outer membrane protein [Bacteroidaceae bacterium]|nr:RagB/SusD family nutrient uptake outer membrane protein [Bacteroidaceae bacterium]
MKTKNIIRTIRTATLAVAVSGMAASCDDFLSIEPLNDIVLEKFWTNEADVTSVMNACYTQLESADCIQRMIVWGELRSDNMTTGSGISNEMNQILKENLLETNNLTDWQSFYKVINSCNTVLHYAPSVNELDPNFTDSELKATIAEATTLRALCYFYLIRTFRDVPYVTTPSIDDTQNYRVAPIKFDALLDSLITSVELVKDDAVRSYGEDAIENTAKITRWAAYTLLADMYLWKGDYQRCIDYCDLVIKEKQRLYEIEHEENATTTTLELYGDIPLIAESPSGTTVSGNTYNEIFGTGNSFESIFELSFMNNQSVTNSTISSLYGSSSVTEGRITAPTYLFSEAFSGNNKYFSKTDCRYLENMAESSSRVAIQKYVIEELSFRPSTTSGSAPRVTATRRNTNYANWIIYRLSDVLLMKAEAEVELAGNVDGLAQMTEEQDNHYRRAFACVSAVWKRANNKRTATTDTLIYDDYANSRITMEDLVFDERQREFLFEGKRWYDLVRLSRRDNSNTRMVSKVLSKFEQNVAAIRIKLASQDALFFPYYKNELDANPYLEQNAAYVTDDTSARQ